MENQSMKYQQTFLSIAFLFLTVSPTLRSQLAVGSYERKQPFLFCGNTAISEEFSAPFSYANLGTDVIKIDSAIASGDTADFWAHYNAQARQFYVNPVVRSEILQSHGVQIGGLGFVPTTVGDKQLTITMYYHVNGEAKTSLAVMVFHTAQVSSGLSFLTLVPDTIQFLGSTAGQITTDRTATQDTLFRSYRVKENDTARAYTLGLYRIDLTSCGTSSLTDIELHLDRPEDDFKILAPIFPKEIITADSTLVNFLYVPHSSEPRFRTATATFVDQTGEKVVLHLTIEVLKPSSVEGRSTSKSIPIVECLPNPASGELTVRYQLSEAGTCRFRLVSILGQCTLTVQQIDNTEAGNHTVTLPLQDAPPGSYLFQLDVNDSRTTQMVVIH